MKEKDILEAEIKQLTEEIKMQLERVDQVQRQIKSSDYRTHEIECKVKLSVDEDMDFGDGVDPTYYAQQAFLDFQKSKLARGVKLVDMRIVKNGVNDEGVAYN